MKRREMLLRLAKDEEPLILSIEKWQDIVNGTGKNYGSDNCALCEVFYNCKDGCPVFKKTRRVNCRKTPFTRYVKALTRKKRMEAAKAEILFLNSLMVKRS